MINGVWFILLYISLANQWGTMNHVGNCRVPNPVEKSYSELSMLDVYLNFYCCHLSWFISGLHFPDNNCPTAASEIFQIFHIFFIYCIFPLVLFLICANFCAIHTSSGALECGFLCKLCQKLHPTEPFCHCNFVSIEGCDSSGWVGSIEGQKSQRSGQKYTLRKRANSIYIHI